MYLVRLGILFLAITFLFSFAKHPAPDDRRVNVDKLVELVNDLRKKGCKCGGRKMRPVAPLSWNRDLEKAALKHSRDMKNKNYFDHRGSNGSDPAARVKAEGYQWMAVAENIAEGYDTEQEVVNAWLKSPGHCRNMMGAAYKELGVGKSGKYWTMVVASR